MAGDPSSDPADDPGFDIPARPRRRYPYEGGVEYEGETVFTLTPVRERSGADLRELVEVTLSAGPYRHGDFLDLPMPLYLVRDDGTGDVFRVSIRDGRVRLHVLPATESAGLEAFFDRLTERSDTEWFVDCHTSG
jgi:hypothetical protein